MDSKKIKQLVMSHRKFFQFATKVYNHLVPKNKLHAKGVTLNCGVVLINGLKIYSNGRDNQIVLGDFVQIRNSTIIIQGSHNRVSLGDFSVLNQVELCMMDDHNEFVVGEHTGLCGKAELAAVEGTKIVIGDRCMFSGLLHFRTGDSHSVVDMNGKRINPSRDIVIGNHVWIGTRVTCLKGVRVPDNCIVEATTTLCGQYQQENTVIAGVPGKVVKTGVNWNAELLPMDRQEEKQGLIS